MNSTPRTITAKLLCLIVVPWACFHFCICNFKARHIALWIVNPFQPFLWFVLCRVFLGIYAHFDALDSISIHNSPIHTGTIANCNFHTVSNTLLVCLNMVALLRNHSIYVHTFCSNFFWGGKGLGFELFPENANFRCKSFEMMFSVMFKQISMRIKNTPKYTIMLNGVPVHQRCCHSFMTNIWLMLIM